MAKQYKQFKNVWISTTPVLPGVWERKDGGHVVRSKVTVEATGRKKEIFRVLPEADAPTALRWLHEERQRLRNGQAQQPRMRFAEFAASLFDHKVRTGDIKSAAGRNKWLYTLKHLVTDFGDFYLDKLRASDLEVWRRRQAERVAAGEYAPATVNGWLAILRVILKAAKRQLGLELDATEGVRFLDTSEHDTYTEEEPNALAPSEVAPFVDKFREMYPQHFAMLFLGLVTGLRPSSLRPLRRKGPEADVLWDSSRLAVRRSHTHGDEVMRTTKQKRKYTIDLPREVMRVLEWHVASQLRTDEQKESDLLFPTEAGSFRTPKILLKPMAVVATELGIEKKITPRALRRTFNDLARAAEVSDLVTRSISGHLTDQMQRHYSTVSSGEQRQALAKVIQLFGAKTADPSASMMEVGASAGAPPPKVGAK